MKVKALVSFSGVFSMRKGQEADLQNPALLADLLQAGYIEKMEKEAPKPDPKPEKKKSQKKGK